MENTIPDPEQENAEKPRREKLINAKNRKNIIIAVILIAAAIAVFFLLYRLNAVTGFISWVNRILAPVLGGVALAYIMNPLMEKMRRPWTRHFTGKMKDPAKAAKLAKGLAIAVCTVILILVIGGLLWMVIPQLYDSIVKLISGLPRNLENLQAWYASELAKGAVWAKFIEQYLESFLDGFNNWVKTELATTVNNAFGYITGSVVTIITVIINCVIALVISVYALMEKDNFVAKSKKLTYTLFKTENANQIVDTARHANDMFSGFIVTRIIDSLIIGVCTFIGMTIFRMPYPLLISVVMGVTTMIPFFGPFIGGIPSAFFILLEDPWQALWFLVMIIVIVNVEGNLVSPKLLGSRMGFSQFWVMFALILFGGLYGITGMVIGAPLFSVICYVAGNLLNIRARRKGIPLDSAEYLDADRMDPETHTLLMKEETPRKKGSFRARRNKKQKG